MTHDELLAKIEPKQKTAGEWLAGFEALRAVVKLHKPFNGMCDACSIRGQFIPATYPCRTIQAIEEQLE